MSTKQGGFIEVVYLSYFKEQGFTMATVCTLYISPGQKKKSIK